MFAGKCRKKLVDKLIEEGTKSIDEVEITEITENKCKYSSCTLYIVLFSIIFTISMGIGIYFTYFYWYLNKDIPRVEFNTHTQTTV